MTKTMTRRSILKNSAAMTASLGLLSVAGLKKSFASENSLTDSRQHDCKQYHSAMAEELSNMARTSGSTSQPISYALKTAHCPHCQTQIGIDTATL